MEKKIKVSAKFDMAEFDRDLDRMKDKLKEMYAPSNQARQTAQTAQRAQSQGLAPSGFAQQAQGLYKATANQDMQQLDNYIKKQATSNSGINKALENRTKQLKELKKEYSDIIKLGEEDLKLKQQIAKTEASVSRLREVNNQKNVNINAAMDARQEIASGLPQKREQERLSGMRRLGTAYQHGGIGGMGKSAFRMMKQNPFGVASGAAALVGAGINLAVPIMRQEDSAERRTLGAQGRAVSNAGFMQENVMQGNGQTNMFWMGENNKAMQSAIKEMKEQRKTDNWKVGGAAAAVTGGLGMAATGVGALPGLALSAGGAAYAGYNFVSDENMRNKMLGGMGFSGRRQRYESGLVEGAMSNYKENLENEKRLNPFKRMGEQYYDRNGMRNLKAQRQTGLDDEGMYGEGGFLKNILGSGFTQEQGMSMMNQISASGGSTRMSQDPTQALKYVRQMNLTNAGSVMGKLSGTMGGAGETDQATIKILAEGMKQGLNSSDFAEEQRKFASTVSQMVFRSGTQDVEGAQGIAKNFASYLNDKTSRGIQGAEGAYGIQQGISSTSGGIRGAIQASSIMNSSSLGKMSHDQRLSFMDLSEEDIAAGGAEIESMAKAAGVSVEEFKKEAMKVKRNAVGLRSSTDGYKAKYQEAMASGDEEGARDIMGNYISALAAEDKTFKGKGRSEREAFAKSNLSATGAAADDTGVLKELTKDSTGRIGDDTEKSRARSQEIALDEFTKVKDELQQAAENASNMSAAMMEALQGLANAVKQEGTQSVEEFGKNLKLLNEELRKSNQSSGYQQQPTGGKRGN